MIRLGFCFSLIHFVGPLLAVMVELFLFGYLFLVVGNAHILICFPLLGESMEESASLLLICSMTDGNSLHMLSKGYMGSCNLCKLSHS
jgi:hypothetical protein